MYVRYRVRDLAIDDFRLAVEAEPGRGASPLMITHVWRENGIRKTAAHKIAPGVLNATYSIDIPEGADVENESVVFECPTR